MLGFTRNIIFFGLNERSAAGESCSPARRDADCSAFCTSTLVDRTGTILPNTKLECYDMRVTLCQWTLCCGVKLVCLRGGVLELRARQKKFEVIIVFLCRRIPYLGVGKVK